MLYIGRGLLTKESNGQEFLISAEHLEQIEGYNKIYSATDRDVALYVSNSNLTSYPIGTKVTCEYLRDTKIVKTGNGWFEISMSNPENVTTGMSGNRVYYKNNSIGFISKLTEDNTLLCYTLEL